MKRNRERLMPEEWDKRIDDAIGRGSEAEKEFWKLLEEIASTGLRAEKLIQRTKINKGIQLGERAIIR